MKVKKRTKKSNLTTIVFVRFLEESKTPKRHFEINWPLLQKLFHPIVKQELFSSLISPGRAATFFTARSAT
jgi:hypothetical protein